MLSCWCLSKVSDIKCWSPEYSWVTVTVQGELWVTPSQPRRSTGGSFPQIWDWHQQLDSCLGSLTQCCQPGQGKAGPRPRDSFMTASGLARSHNSILTDSHEFIQKQVLDDHYHWHCIVCYDSACPTYIYRDNLFTLGCCSDLVSSCQLWPCLSFRLRSADPPGLKKMFNIGVVNPDTRSIDNDDNYVHLQVIKEGNVITGDLGGSAKCSEFTNEIIRKIEAM